MVKGFNHVAVNVSDVDKSRQFYEKIIGLRKIPRPDLPIPGEWYGVGTNQLHLIGGKRLPGGIDPTGPHMALEVDDLEAARAELRRNGIEFLDAAALRMNLTAEQRKMVGQQIWVKDPDGNVIELRQSE